MSNQQMLAKAALDQIGTSVTNKMETWRKTVGNNGVFEAIQQTMGLVDEKDQFVQFMGIFATYGLLIAFAALLERDMQNEAL